MTEAVANPMMQTFSQAITPDKLAGVEMTVQLRLSGQGGGDWYVEIHNGESKLVQGLTDAAGLTIESSLEDFKDLVDGRLDGAQAFMSGRLKVQGNILLMLKLASIMGKKA